MAKERNNVIAAAGALLGVTLILGLVVLKDKRLQREVKGQMDTALDTTKKLLGKYKNVASLVVPGFSTGSEGTEGQETRVARRYDEAAANILTKLR